MINYAVFILVTVLMTGFCNSAYSDQNCNYRETSSHEFSSKSVNMCNRIWFQKETMDPWRFNDSMLHTFTPIGPRIALISKHVVSSVFSLESFYISISKDFIQNRGEGSDIQTFMSKIRLSYHVNPKFYDYKIASDTLRHKVDKRYREEGVKTFRLSELESLPGWWDVVVIVQPDGYPDFKPPYASLSKQRLRTDDEIIFYNRNWRIKPDTCESSELMDGYLRFKVLSFTKDTADVILSGSGTGYDPFSGCPSNLNDRTNNSITWPTSSGSMYLRKNRKTDTFALVGLHSRGNWSNLEKYVPNATGVNLTSPEIQKWILKVADENKVCGLTLDCPGINFKP